MPDPRALTLLAFLQGDLLNVRIAIDDSRRDDAIRSLHSAQAALARLLLHLQGPPPATHTPG